MYSAPPAGITPPTPGLEHEEPELAVDEHDIPPEDDSVEGGDGLREVERE